MARMVIVFALWAGVFAASVAAGASVAWAELGAAVGAGLTLVLWGLASQRRPARVAASELPIEEAQERGRASM